MVKLPLVRDNDKGDLHCFGKRKEKVSSDSWACKAESLFVGLSSEDAC